MYRFVLVLVVFLVHKCSSLRTKEIYVSLDNGKDVPSCGRLTKPCKTLGYAFKVVTTQKVRININLDGGNSTPLVYVMLHSVTVSSCKIRRFRNSKQNPVISSRSIGHSVFGVRGSFELSSINFETLTVVKALSEVSLTFKDCSFRNSRIIEAIGSKSANIEIYSSKIYSEHNTPIFIYLKNNAHIKLIIEDSQVNGSGIYISKTNFTIRIVKSIFRKFHWSLSTSKLQSMSNLKIYDCVFYKSNLKLIAYGRATLKRNNFRASILTAQTWKYLHFYHSNFSLNDQMFLLLRDLSYVSFNECIMRNNNGSGSILCTRLQKLRVTNCLFKNNHFNNEAKYLRGYACDGGALCLKTVDYTWIEKSKFVNNSGIQGGAIYIWKSSVTIKNSEFLFNKAWQFGGAIYSEGNKRITLTDTVIYGPYSSRYSPQGHLLYSKTAMKLYNVTFVANSNNLDNSVIVYIDTVQDVRSKKHTILSSYYLQCPVGYNVDGTYWIEPKSKQYKYISAKCTPCGKGKYNLKFGKSYKHKNMTNIKQNNVTCLSCPSGGICNNRIESAGNYWGYVDEYDHVQFIACPMNYCCTRYGTSCTSYNTCERNRNGKLCGTCKPGYSLDLLSSKCIENVKCTKVTSALFGLFQVVGAVCYVLCFMYLKEIACFVTRFINWKEIKKLCVGSIPVVETDSTTTVLLSSSTTGSINTCEGPDVNTRDRPDVNTCEGTDVNIPEGRDENTPEGTYINTAQGTDVNTPEVPDALINEPEDREGVDDSSNVRFVYFADTSELTRSGFVSSKKRSSGIIKIAFFFYQIEAILRVNAPLKSKYRHNNWFINTLISSIFNIKLNPESKWFNVCPVNGLTTIAKELLRISFVISLFVILFMLSCITILWNRYNKPAQIEDKHDCCYGNEIDDRIPTHSKLPFLLRIQCSAIKLSLFGYMAISTFLFKCLNCVTIGNSLNLYIQGNIECLSSWSFWLVIIIVIVWVAPFCFVLWGGSKLLYSCKMSPNDFFIMLLFPPMLLFYYWRSKNGKIILTKRDAMTAKHYLMVLYEPFQRNATTGRCTMWECTLIFRKLLLVVVYTLIIHPVGKLYALLFLLLLYLIHHIYEQPYYDMFLNIVESISLALLCFLASINLFWAHTYMVNDSNVPQFSIIGEVFLYFELLVLVLPVLMVGGVVVVCVLIRLFLCLKERIRVKGGILASLIIICGRLKSIEDNPVTPVN